jgi:RimJ/RimL family protein N-acetyltransferase
MDLTHWRGVSRPEASVIDGRYARLERLDPARHGQHLFESAVADGSADRFRYLPEVTPPAREAFDAWLTRSAASPDPLFYAVIDKANGRAEGRQTLMRIDAANGVIEIGNILWGPAIARSRVATEALYLFAEHIFALGYRRFEWKCNDHNEPSKRAALRFGFQAEGVFRQHMVVKGLNRDTAWFSIIDRDWPRIKAGYQRWLEPLNFDDTGMQKSRLDVS